MPQLHLYLPEKTAEQVRQEAKARKMSVSRYLAEIVTRQMDDGWPPGWFDRVVGAWKCEPLERPPQDAPPRAGGRSPHHRGGSPSSRRRMPKS